MSDLDQRRERRRSAQRLLDGLAIDLLALPRVNIANMFGSDGLRVDTKFFAFVGRDGELVVKLPAARAAALVAAGEAHPIRTGRNTTREWVGVPCPGDHARPEPWPTLLTDAWRYVASLTSPTRTARLIASTRAVSEPTPDPPTEHLP